MRAVRLVVLLLMGVALLPLAFNRNHPVHAQDAVICSQTDGTYYRANIFPRYEPQNRRLMLADWSTGENVQEIAANLDYTVALDWSLDCRYLAVAVGSSESMDTVVFDTVSNTRIGSVPDAHYQPHHITWGPGDYLIVETRSGAILWNVPANTQLTLTTLYNTTTNRNFDRIRWHPEVNQILVNFAVGGRTAYDLTTGQEVPAAAVTDSVPGEGQANVAVGGREYECHDGYRYGYKPNAQDPNYTVPSIYANYDSTDGLIYLSLSDDGRLASNYYDEVLQVVENNVHASWFTFRSWSANCRFFAGTLGVSGTNDTETIVWDVTTNQRVGTWTAHGTQHIISWDPTGDFLLIQTRDGAVIVNLSAASSVLLPLNVEMTPDGSTVQNFYDFAWDEVRGVLLGVPVGVGATVTAYDPLSGQQVAAYSCSGASRPVKFKLSPDGSLIVVYSPPDEMLFVWNRDTGSSIQLTPGTDIQDGLVDSGYGWSRIYRSSLTISPDNHYLAVDRYNTLVWDLRSPNLDGTPTVVYEAVAFSGAVTFIDNVTLAYGGSEMRLNVTNGDIYNYRAWQLPAPNPLEGETGPSPFGTYSYRYRPMIYCGNQSASYSPSARHLTVNARETGEVIRILEQGLNETDFLQWSPDCTALTGEVSIINNETVPYDNAPFDDRIRDRHTYQLVIWDAATGERLRTYACWGAVDWSPDSSLAFIDTCNGYLIYNRATNADTMISYTLQASAPNTYWHAINTEYSRRHYGYHEGVYWDFQRGQVLISGWRGVHAFDLRTGIERTVFPQECGYLGCHFIVSDDNTTLSIYGAGGLGNTWNLDTFACKPRRGDWGDCSLDD